MFSTVKTMFSTDDVKSDPNKPDDDSVGDGLSSMYNDVLFNHSTVPEESFESDNGGWEAMNDNKNAILGSDDDDDNSENSIYDTIFDSESKEEPAAPNKFDLSRRFESFATGIHSYDSNDLLSMGDNDDESIESMEEGNIFQHQVVESKKLKKSRISSRRKFLGSTRFESFKTGMGSYDSNDLLSCDSEDDVSLGSDDGPCDIDLSGTFRSSLTKNVRSTPIRIPSQLEIPRRSLHFESDPRNISQSSEDSSFIDDSTDPDPDMFDLSELDLTFSTRSSTPTVAHTEVSGDS